MRIIQEASPILVMLLGFMIRQCPAGADFECDHERQEDNGRRCLKSCESDEDCDRYEEECLCDGKCGKSCINPDLRCLPEPRHFPHGRVSIFPRNRFGAIASYSCDYGFVLAGLGKRVCQGDESWMGEPPICEPNHGVIGQNQDCGPPPTVHNAVHTGGPHQFIFKFGTTLNYTCLPGFIPESAIYAWCVNGGVWVGPKMTCSTSGCAAPPAIPNGHLEMPSQNILGSIVKYTCDPEFFLVGIAERTCLKDGTWDGREPSCQQVVCGPPPTVENAEHDAPKDQFQFLTGTQLTYTCDFGYYKEGTGRTICSANEGKWIGPNFSCKVRDCGAPGEINNGWRDPGYRFTYPTTVTYHCNDGFELKGQSPFRECQADGGWSGVLPECQPISCGELAPPVHGTMIGSGTDYGSLIRFVCNNGYRAVGSTERTCQADGTWSGQNVFCEEIICGYPGPLWNGYVDGHSTRVGAEFYFRCNARTKFNGTSNSTWCLANGQWSHDLPQCLGQCQVPSILNGNVTNTRGVIWVDHGFVLNLKCLNKLELNDSRSVKCENGTWSIIPRCVPAPCRHPPPQIADGHRVFFHLAHGSRARYFCIAGYKLVGSHQHMTCAFGEWVGDRPRCEENFCPHPGVLCAGEILKLGTHGKFQFSDYIVTIKHGDRLEYRCNSTHRLVGPKGAACVNGKWSPSERPKCVPSQHPLFPKLWHPFEEKG